MADFTSLVLNANTGTNGTPVWTTVGASGSGTGVELRFSDVSSAGATASASWPFMTRPAATAGVDYCYAFSADTTSLGVLGTTSTTPAAFSNSSYMQFRWNWDNTGTFAGAPIFTAYLSTAHAAITRSPDATNGGTANLLQGSTTDTGGTARSYLKGALFGRVVSAGAPAAAPGSAPVVTDGTTGSISPTAGANWSAWQGLMGDTDYITAAATPAATTADQLNCMLRLFTGPSQTAGTYTVTVSLKYTFT